MSSEHLDFVVIGGNISGTCSALALHQLGFSVALVEPNPIEPNPIEPSPSTPTANSSAFKAPNPPPFKLRVSAINPVSQKFLTQLGCWQNLPPQRLQKVTSMNVGEEQQWVNFDEKAVAHELAYIVENDCIQATLWSMLQQTSVQLIEAKMVSFSSQTVATNPVKQIELTSKQGFSTITCQVLVGADGANSEVRQQAAIGWRQKDYQQHCMVGNVKPQHHHQNAAWQAYKKGFAIALLPHPDGSCSLAWYLSAAEAEKYAQTDLAEIQTHLNRALQSAHLKQLGTVEVSSPLKAFPIYRRRAEKYAKPALFLVGDACRTVHPMAGQGLNLALTDVAILQQQMCLAQQQQIPLHHPSLSSNYCRLRSEDRVVQNGMDLLHGFFQSTHLSPLRPWLIKGLQKLPLVHKPLIKTACGQFQDLPASLKNRH